ncbi:porin [Cupriavidus consociatus]|uniref:porin n=1 Tax=Cupriavidus consociatus TaxID=2821357 RepID=UPI001AEB835C|nr:MULTISPECIES: porin [unclassified Cupriavidus]MBP0618548.1 porin [Cupriavidus sp. LEh25]MDK2655184.1 porin [Cupriavidus sp. LEh21]
MKQRIVFLAAVLACGVAKAQSSVTLYGVADINVEYVNHVGVVPQASNGFNSGRAQKVFRENSGGYSGSRWGLRGTEDLGGGLKSVFALEGGFNVDTGTQQQGGRMFGRQAFAGLDTRIGQITFGRQYHSLFSTLANFVPARFATQYEPAAVIAGANFREDNVVKYTGKFGPLIAQANWSFGVGTALPQTNPAVPGAGGGGEVPGQFRRDTAYGAGLSYMAGPVGLGLAYDQWNPTMGTGTGTYKKAAAMASYAFNDTAKVMGGYRWGQNKDQTGRLVVRDDFYWIGGQYRLSPALDFTLEYDYQNIRNLGGSTSVANPWQIALIVDYSLSKRTDIYPTTAYSKNAGLTLDSAASGFPSSLALGNSYALANGQSSMFGAAVGIRHIF